MLSSIFTSTEKFKRTENDDLNALRAPRRSRKQGRKDSDENDDKERVGVEHMDDELTAAELSRIGGRKERKKPRKPKSDGVDPGDGQPEAAKNEGEEMKEEEEQGEDISDNVLDNRLKNRRTLFVGNVAIQATPKDLKSFFSKCGDVESIRLRSLPLEGTKVDDHGNQNLVKRVSAQKNKLGDQKVSQNVYIVFKDEESVAKALACDDTLYMDRHLRVDRASAPSRFEPSTTVFLGGLSKFADEERLREFFAAGLPNKAGDIKGVRLVRDPETLYGKGFGYLLLSSRDAVMSALKFHGKKFKGRNMRVTTCGKRTKKQVQEKMVKMQAKKERRENAPAAASTEAGNDDQTNAAKEGGATVTAKTTVVAPKQKKPKSLEVEAAAARRIKAKMAKTTASIKRTKTKGLNKGDKKSKKLGGVIKKAMKAVNGKLVGKGTKSDARFKSAKPAGRK